MDPKTIGEQIVEQAIVIEEEMEHLGCPSGCCEDWPVCIHTGAERILKGGNDETNGKSS